MSLPDEGKPSFAEQVSDELDNKPKGDEAEDKEETDEEKQAKEEEADRLLGQKVKVPTSQGKEREMSVKDVIGRYGNLEAEFTKGQQILKDPDRLRAYLESEHGIKLPAEKSEVPAKSETGDEDQQTLEEGKRLGFLTREELGQEKKLWKEELKLEMTLESLEEDIDGSDGRPAFDKYEVAKYMHEEGFRDPMKAYKDKFEPELAEWDKKKNGGEKPTFTEKPTSTIKLPAGKSMGKLTEKEARDVMSSMLEEGGKG